MYFVGNLAVSDTFIVCFEIVTNDPFWVESLQSKSACPVYEHWFFLQDESVADFWIFWVEAEIDAEAGDHAGEDSVVEVVAVLEFELDGVDEIEDGWVFGIELEVLDDLNDLLYEFFGLEECFSVEESMMEPVVEFVFILLQQVVELGVDVAQVEEISFLRWKFSVLYLVQPLARVYRRVE